jgi:hypothetical protein
MSKVKKSFKGSISNFPKQVVKKMLEEQVKQGNPKNINVFEESKTRGVTVGGFTWADTDEGHDFWEDVINDEMFSVFFARYPKKTKKLKIEKVKPVEEVTHITDFPEEIVAKMLEEQVKQGNPKNIKVFEKNVSPPRSAGGFTWSDTDDGQRFWEKVISYKDFNLFFKEYPKDIIGDGIVETTEIIELNEPIYRMNRKGSFSVSHKTANQCGAEGLERYEFEITTILKQDLDEDGFVFDHDLIQATIDNLTIYGSCEEMQKKIYKAIKEVIPSDVLLGYKCAIRPLDFYIKAYIEYIACSKTSYYTLL